MTTITQAQINKVTSKSTGETVYSVKSDSSDTYYRMTWNVQAIQWECDCPATKPCKHLRALQEVLKAKRAAAQESIKANKPLETSQKGHLHGSQGFSLMR